MNHRQSALLGKSDVIWIEPLNTGSAGALARIEREARTIEALKMKN